MRIVINGGSADIHRDLARYLWDEGFFLHSERIEKFYFMHKSILTRASARGDMPLSGNEHLLNEVFGLIDDVSGFSEKIRFIKPVAPGAKAKLETSVIRGQ